MKDSEAIEETVLVPDDAPSIQEAINLSRPGGTILVKSGVYKEDIVINKPLNLMGIDAVIRATGMRDAVQILSGNVRFEGFCIISSPFTPHSGIYVKSSGAYIVNTSVSGFLYGVQIYDSTNITLKGNVMFQNVYNLKVWGLTINHFFHQIDTSNLVEGGKVYYYVNASDVVVPHDAGYVGIINSKNVTVADANMRHNGEGVLIAYSQNCRVINSKIWGNERGVRLLSCRNVSVEKSEIFANGWAGVVIDSSRDTLLRKNLFYNNRVGVMVSSSILLNLVSDRNMVLENNLVENDWGIYVNNAFYNRIERNVITDNSYGLTMENSDGNLLFGNLFSNCSVGVRISNSRNNTFYYNSFESNKVHVCFEGFNIKNFWDAGYPAGGNYWDNIEVVDELHGSSQNYTGSDGILDKPYIVGRENFDRYPLASPLTFLSIVTGNKENLFTLSSSLSLKEFRFNARKSNVVFQFESPSNNSVRVGIPKYLLWSESIDDWRIFLDGDEYHALVLEDEIYTYFYLTLPLGTFKLRFEAMHSILEFFPQGDVNFDGEVNLKDLLIVLEAFGSSYGSSRWNLWADINGDGKIDLKDAVLEVLSIIGRC